MSTHLISMNKGLPLLGKELSGITYQWLYSSIPISSESLNMSLVFSGLRFKIFFICEASHFYFS